MIEKIESILNAKGRKQRGKIKLKKRVNITFPQNSIALIANKNINLTIEQLKIIKLDITKTTIGLYNILFQVLPNKPITKKGILVRMGKGKGKIDTFSCKIAENTICIILKPKILNIKNIDTTILTSFLKKYPFFSKKSF